MALPFKRVRDKLRNFRPLDIVSFADWKDIENRFIFANAFLTEENPAYQILKSDLEHAKELVLHNRVHEVKEVRLIGEIQKIFTTNKEEQMNELVGQIKYIEGYLQELESWIRRKQQLESLEAAGKVIIRRAAVEERLDERPQ